MSSLLVDQLHYSNSHYLDYFLYLWTNLFKNFDLVAEKVCSVKTNFYTYVDEGLFT